MEASVTSDEFEDATEPAGGAKASVASGSPGVHLAEEAAALELHGLTKRYGDVVAVDALDLRIAPGEFFALLGPSGCGKTTTLRSMAGFEQPDSGTISLGGADVTEVPPFRRDVNLVFQEYALFPHLNLRDNVAFGLKMKRISRRERQQRAEDMLERVAMGGLGDRGIKEISGGQQQRVALARALINHPKVLLLDEPLGALDLKLRRTMQLELKAIQRDAGISFVHVTHDQEEALAMADRIAVMNAGRALQIGAPKEIYDSPTSRFVADFIGESSFLEGKAEGSGADLVQFTLGSGERILVRPGRQFTGPAVAMVRPEHLEVVKLDAEQSSYDGAVNRLEATVTELEYGGSDVHYFLAASGGERLTSRMPASGDVMSPGERVAVVFPAARTVLVQADEPAQPEITATA
jgi:spermidine/putrescine transport system ATP-binding protein